MDEHAAARRRSAFSAYHADRVRLRTERAILAAILVAFFALFARTIKYDWVWDDVAEIAQNPLFDRPLADGLGASQLAKQDASLVELRGVELEYDSYRPLLYATYWMDVRVFGRLAAPMHATNLIFGLVAIALAYAVARRWFGSAIALVPVALFALHPQQVEAVAYISGRGDLLAGLFALLATYAALRVLDDDRPRWYWVAVALIAYPASLASKETCVALFAVVGLMAFVRAPRRWWIAAAMLAAGGLYLYVRAQLAANATGAALGDALRILPDTWLAYMKIALLPFDLSTERMLGHAALGPVAWAIAFAIAGVLGVGLWKWRAPTATFAVGFAWFALLVGPSAVAIQMTGVIADRYMYVPLFGLGLVLAAAVRAGVRARPKLAAPLAIAGVLWAGLLGVVAWRQVRTWESNATLYANAVAMEPESSMAQYRLAYLSVLSNDWEAALPRLELAVQLDGRNTRALNNLGVGLLRLQRFADAEPVLARAVSQDPGAFRSWANLGAVEVKLGKRDLGCKDFARALAINPSYEFAKRATREACH